MPLTEQPRCVAGLFQYLGDRYFLQGQLTFDPRLQQPLRRRIGTPRKIIGEVEPRGTLAGHDRRSRWRANRLSRVRTSESHPLRRETVEVGRAMIVASVAPEIVDPKIVGQDQNDVWPRSGVGRLEYSQRSRRECGYGECNRDESFHGYRLGFVRTVVLGVSLTVVRL